MIRVAAISDSHFDERGDLLDVVQTHAGFVEQAVDAGVDLVVHAGDWFDRESSPTERLALADWLGQVSEHFTVVGVKGNHDSLRDLGIFGRIRGRHPITIFERPAPGGFEVARVEVGCTKRTLATILPLPWFDKAPVAATMDGTQDQAATRLATIEQARLLLTSYSAASARAHAAGQPVILLAHVMVQASRVANGQVLMGHSVELSPGDLRLSGADYCAVGHVHQHQAWEAVGAAPVVYSGSPTRHDHGEPEAKGWILVTFDGPRLVSWEFRKLPARELYHVEIDATQPEVLLALKERRVEQFIDPRAAAGARVRVRYKIAAEDLALVDEELLWRVVANVKAYEIKIERQAQATTVARAVAVEVSTQESLGDKVKAYLNHKSLGDRWERLAPHLAELENS